MVTVIQVDTVYQVEELRWTVYAWHRDPATMSVEIPLFHCQKTITDMLLRLHISFFRFWFQIANVSSQHTSLYGGTQRHSSSHRFALVSQSMSLLSSPIAERDLNPSDVRIRNKTTSL